MSVKLERGGKQGRVLSWQVGDLEFADEISNDSYRGMFKSPSLCTNWHPGG